MNILQINSSARRDASHSTRLATRIVQRLRDADPEATVTVRDLEPRAAPGLSTKRRSARSSRPPISARRSRQRAWRSTMH